jgi:hypothetical protein
MKGLAIVVNSAAPIAVTATFARVTHLFGSEVDWLAALSFAVPFALVYGPLW